MNITTLHAIRQCFQHIPQNDERTNIGPRAFVVNLISAMSVSPRASAL